MAERYWITGVQLGLMTSEYNSQSERKNIASIIIGKQFIGNFPTDNDKKRFIKQIEEVK